MTKKQLLQENKVLLDLLFQIRNCIDAEVEEYEEGTDDPEGEEATEDDE